jgi:hypothetical protein
MLKLICPSLFNFLPVTASIRLYITVNHKASRHIDSSVSRLAQGVVVIAPVIVVSHLTM